METKKCTKCGEIKPLTELTTCSKCPLGTTSTCKLCHNKIGTLKYVKKKEIIYGDNKRCNKCNLIKSKDEFNKGKNNSDGKCGHCKECQKILTKIQFEKNKDKIKENKKKYLNSEHGKIKEKERRKKYYLHNKKEENIRSNEWNKLNRDKMKIYKNEYSKTYRKNNKELHAWRGILHNSLRKLNKNKEGHTIDLLGYSALDLKNYITTLFTDGMSWDNHGEWHIDHIKPVSSFDPETPMNIVNALSNLQPLWATTREINGVIYEGNLNKGIKF